MRRIFALLCIVSLLSLRLSAQDLPADRVNVTLDARLDYDNAFGTADKSFNGFKGKYLLFKVTGNLGEHWSYVYRQRPNKINKNSDFMNSIDFAHLTWKAENHWSVTAGKQTVAIGGYEYDAVPIDLYFTSEFWSNVNCFIFAAGGTYATTSGKDSFTFQLSESPFRERTLKDLYGVNLMWSGSHGIWSTLYSANFFDEYRKGGIGYISLGNRLSLGKSTLDIDFQSRIGIAPRKVTFGSDFTAIVNWKYEFNAKWDAFVKYSHDHNKDNYADLYVLPGTSINSVGGGVEFFPYKKSIRLHLCGFYGFGDNANPSGTLVDGKFALMIGFTWKMKLFSI